MPSFSDTLQPRYPRRYRFARKLLPRDRGTNLARTIPNRFQYQRWELAGPFAQDCPGVSFGDIRERIREVINVALSSDIRILFPLAFGLRPVEPRPLSGTPGFSKAGAIELDPTPKGTGLPVTRFPAAEVIRHLSSKYSIELEDWQLRMMVYPPAYELESASGSSGQLAMLLAYIHRALAAEGQSMTLPGNPGVVWASGALSHGAIAGVSMLGEKIDAFREFVHRDGDDNAVFLLPWHSYQEAKGTATFPDTCCLTLEAWCSGAGRSPNWEGPLLVTVGSEPEDLSELIRIVSNGKYSIRRHGSWVAGLQEWLVFSLFGAASFGLALEVSRAARLRWSLLSLIGALFVFLLLYFSAAQFLTFLYYDASRTPANWIDRGTRAFCSMGCMAGLAAYFCACFWSPRATTDATVFAAAYGGSAAAYYAVFISQVQRRTSLPLVSSLVRCRWQGTEKVLRGEFWMASLLSVALYEGFRVTVGFGAVLFAVLALCVFLVHVFLPFVEAITVFVRLVLGDNLQEYGRLGMVVRTSVGLGVVSAALGVLFV